MYTATVISTGTMFKPSFKNMSNAQNYTALTIYKLTVFLSGLFNYAVNCKDHVVSAIDE
jgi:hypothetical protein